jgi:prolyl-tRNA synthetase
MLRAGLIRREAPGVYSLLPLGIRAVQKVAAIVRQEMDRQGGQEIMMPLLSPAEPWFQTGRWQDYGDEMFRLRDRGGKQFCLAPTHEEIVTGLVRDAVSSYKQLPVRLYHIGPKFRDEIRPRFGVMRSREFLMKDLYSFDTSAEGLEGSYQKMLEAYERVFTKCGLKFRAVEADPGTIGGSGSHEFIALSEHGESIVVTCDRCGYAADVEKAEYREFVPELSGAGRTGAAEEIRKVATPGAHTIAGVAEFLRIPAAITAKTLFYRAVYPGGRSQLVAAIIPGERDLNEWKLHAYLGAIAVEKAAANDVVEETGAPFGSAGPVGLHGARIITDRSLLRVHNLVVGANEEGYHFINVDPERDFDISNLTDLVLVHSGDPCPVCGEALGQTQGIEVGQLFKLWTKYSDALGCVFLDETGNSKPAIMGCYGIGVTRTVAAIIEQHHDADGIVWPHAVAPFDVIVTCVNTRDRMQVDLAEQVYAALTTAGIATLLDDRDERAGVKFKDADLMGFPVRVNVGRKAAQGLVEVVDRPTHGVVEVPAEEAAECVSRRLLPPKE